MCFFISRAFSTARIVVFSVVDSFGDSSQAALVRVTFDSVDDAPLLDLSGSLIAGVNYSVNFTEGDSAIRVREQNVFACFKFHHSSFL